MPCQSAPTTEVASFANGQRQGIPKQSAQQTPAADIQTWDTSARVGDSEAIAPPYSAAYIYIYIYIKKNRRAAGLELTTIAPSRTIVTDGNC